MAFQKKAANWLKSLMGPNLTSGQAKWKRKLTEFHREGKEPFLRAQASLVARGPNAKGENEENLEGNHALADINKRGRRP